MSSTDYFRLTNENMFKTFRETLPKGITKTQNVMCVNDDVVFVWNFQDACILTMNVKSAKNRQLNSIDYQTILPTTPPTFSPELLVCNETCELIAVAGPLGLMVMELPTRGPPDGLFANGKEVIYCKNYLLDERLFSDSKLLEVRQVRWHPGSRTSSYLLVLTSDNMFRLYKYKNFEISLVKVYQIGTQPVAVLPGTRLPFLATLGETGVDFDFGLPQTIKREKKSGKWEDLQWPIYILRGDGEVFIMYIDITDEKKALITGPLAMSPSSEDNFGSDSCGIMCFKTSPPVLAISTCTGTIYHGVVLIPDDDSEFQVKKSIVKHSNYTIHPTDYVLYVFESIELELGLAVTDSDISYSCPMFFHTDGTSYDRYFCTHETGIHVVHVPLIVELEKLLDTKDNDLDSCLSTLNKKSSAEYLLCTHVTSATKVNPVIGFSVFHYPTTIVALLANGQVISLPLTSAVLSNSSEKILTDRENVSSPLKRLMNEPFDTYIKNFLRGELNQPILKLAAGEGDAKLSLKECYALLSRATQVFREEHFKKYEKVREEIEKRVKALKMLKEHQIKEVQKMNVQKQCMQENAERLAEKYEDIKDKQEELTKRCEKLLLMVTYKQPQPSEAERNLFKELKNTEVKIKSYAKSIDQVKNKRKYQEIQIKNWTAQEKKTDHDISSNQTAVIKDSLQDMTNQIADMVEKLRVYKNMLNNK